jgi:hypothetical protein
MHKKQPGTILANHSRLTYFIAVAPNMRQAALLRLPVFLHPVGCRFSAGCFPAPALRPVLSSIPALIWLLAADALASLRFEQGLVYLRFPSPGPGCHRCHPFDRSGNFPIALQVAFPIRAIKACPLSSPTDTNVRLNILSLQNFNSQ